MKDLLLIPLLAAEFLFCYFLAGKADDFAEENKRQISEENRCGKEAPLPDKGR